LEMRLPQILTLGSVMSKYFYIISDGNFYANDIRELAMQFFPEHTIKSGLPTESDITLSVNREGMKVKSKIEFMGKKVEKEIVLVKDAQRRQIKTLLYEILSEFTERSLKWGTMTGIRPARVAHGKLIEGKNKNQVIDEIRREYKVEDRRISDLIDIACLEIKKLYPLDIKKMQLYINIPFCPTRCSYCSFITRDSNADSDVLSNYIEKLLEEISFVGRGLKELGACIESVYLGGGTPGILDAGSIESLLGAIRKHMPIDNVLEYTFEAGRPDTITEEKLAAIKNSGIDRISVNPQSLNDATLSNIGRCHNVEEFYKAYELVEKFGFKTINCDMIIGLEGETKADMVRTAEKLLGLGPENITVHSLSLKKSSYLKNSIHKESFFDESETEKAACEIYRMFKSRQYVPYYIYRQKYTANNGENIGFSKAGHEGLYNMAIMSDKRSVIGLGAGSTGKVYYPDTDRFDRMETVKNIELYIRDVKKIAAEKLKQIKSLANDIDMF